MGFEMGSDGPDVIVAGLDGSPTSWHATAYAAGLARRQGARLVVLFVASAPVSTGFAPTATAAIQESLDEVAAQLRQELERNAGWRAMRAEFRVEYGDPYGSLCRVADEERADAVVVGASAQAGHRLIGSLAVKLVRAGRWPVTVVP